MIGGILIEKNFYTDNAFMRLPGSGKTTLLNRILTNQEGYKIAVIVNDIGEINVDAKLIEDGCICCTLKTQLSQSITDLIDSGKYDYIMTEASGVCEPMLIAAERVRCFDENSSLMQCGMKRSVTV